MKKLITVYCDFDGTITQKDVIDLILEKLANPEWLNIESRWIEGEIGSKECLSLQIPLIKGGWTAIESLIKEIQIDPFFKSFSKWCNEKQIPLVVISEGLHKVITSILSREDIEVDSVWSNKLELNKDERFTMQFPYPPKSKDCKLGLCKCQIVEQISQEELKIVIGDGLNDTCWIQKADLIFAKSKLLNYCQVNKIPCESFENFSTITSTLNQIHEETLSVISGELIKNPFKANIHAREN